MSWSLWACDPQAPKVSTEAWGCKTFSYTWNVPEEGFQGCHRMVNISIYKKVLTSTIKFTFRLHTSLYHIILKCQEDRGGRCRYYQRVTTLTRLLLTRTFFLFLKKNISENEYITNT